MNNDKMKPITVIVEIEDEVLYVNGITIWAL